MGLDMYLEITRYVSQFDVVPRKQDEEDHYSRVVREGPPIIESWLEPYGLAQFRDPRNFAMISVTTQAIYWRKANHIHQWFVEHVQGGVDECQRSYLGRDDLNALLKECNKALASRGTSDETDILKPQSGFFFGSTNRDDWYWQQTEYTAERLTKIVALLDKEALENRHYDLHYQASW